MSTNNQGRFFTEAQSAFMSAANNTQLVEHDFALAGLRVHLRFAGPALVSRLLPALSHLPAVSGESDLTIECWDSASTGVALPRVPWPVGTMLSRNEVLTFKGGTKAVFVSSPVSLELWDSSAKKALFWARSADELPYYVSAAPFLYIFQAWAAGHTMQVAHAGAVGVEKGGVLVVGRGGAGKSTVCLACVGSTLKYLGDDYCLVRSQPKPTVFSLYSSGKKEANDTKRLPALSSFIANVHTLNKEKAVYFFSEKREALLAECPIQAVVMPRLRPGEEMSLEPASKLDVIRFLAASTVFQLPSAGANTLALISEIARAVPAFYLNVGPDVTDVPKVLERLLK